MSVLWHLPPSDADESNTNWSGRSVLLRIKPGSCYSTNDFEPKLLWQTVGGGKEGEAVEINSFPLLDIQSIATFKDTIHEGDEADNFMASSGYGGIDEDVCLFAITTDEGEVHVFEATSPRERDLIVAGLKNVIARLSFHLVVGDAGASSELYSEDSKNQPPHGELPSLPDPTKTMNRIAHALLD